MKGLRDVREDAEPIGPAAPEDDGDNLDQLDSVLSDLATSGGADVAIIVAKFNESSTARHGFDLCGRYQAVGFDPFQLPRDFGAGRFRLQFTRRGKIFRNIERSFILPLATQPQGGGPTAGTSPSLESELRENRKFEREMLLTLVTGILGTKGAAAPAPGPSVQDMIALFTAGRTAAAAAPAPIDALREAISLGRSLSSGGDDEDGDVKGRGSFLERVAPRMFDLIERAMTAKPSPAAAPPIVDAARSTIPAGAAAATLTGEGSTVDGDAAALDSMIRRFVPQIIAEARAGRDPRTWGAFIGERCPESYVPHLVRFASGTPAERQSVIATHAPELIAYQDWISEACEGILDVFEPNTADDDAGGTGAAA